MNIESYTPFNPDKSVPYEDYILRRLAQPGRALSFLRTVVEEQEKDPDLKALKIALGHVLTALDMAEERERAYGPGND